MRLSTPSLTICKACCPSTLKNSLNQRPGSEPEIELKKKSQLEMYKHLTITVSDGLNWMVEQEQVIRGFSYI